MPKASPAELQARDDLIACAAILREGSKSFDAASRILPSRVRRPASALYAFCRVADDLIDRNPDPAAGLVQLRRRLDRIYALQPAPAAVDRAFAAAASARRIPRAIPDALFEGFAWDAENRRYPDFAALEAYCVRVAGTVGLMMTLVMGVRSPGALARALDLGVAMQLTNIARDVGEDARAGRLYLPLDWLDEAGVDPAALLAEPRFTPALGAVVRRLLDAANAAYRRADSGVAALPVDCRPAIAAARAIYSGIGGEIARAGYDSVSRRAFVGRSAKLWRLMAATASVRASAAGLSEPPVASARTLLAAVAAMGETGDDRRAGFGERVGGLVDIFARLEQQGAPAAVRAEAG